MLPVAIHPEVVKAAIRMKCGSLRAFAEQSGLKEQAVRDLLRGTSNTAKKAAAELLGVDADQLTISRNVESLSKVELTAHRLIEGGR